MTGTTVDVLRYNETHTPKKHTYNAGISISHTLHTHTHTHTHNTHTHIHTFMRDRYEAMPCRWTGNWASVPTVWKHFSMGLWVWEYWSFGYGLWNRLVWDYGIMTCIVFCWLPGFLQYKFPPPYSHTPRTSICPQDMMCTSTTTDPKEAFLHVPTPCSHTHAV